jgi:hypothetical protein
MDPKMIFTKKSGAYHIAAKVQKRPVSSGIGRSLHKI